jgi:hypothetical protein
MQRVGNETAKEAWHHRKSRRQIGPPRPKMKQPKHTANATLALQVLHSLCILLLYLLCIVVLYSLCILLLYTVRMGCCV